MRIRYMRVFVAASVLALLAVACAGDDSVDDAEASASTVTTQREPDSRPDPDGGPVDGGPVDEASPSGQEQEPVEDPPADEPPADEPPAVEPPVQEPSGPPHTAELLWGDFELSDRIAARLDNGEELNFVISLAATGETGMAASFEHGWSQAAAELAEEHGVDINARVLGPNSADAEAQAAAIESLLASGDIDCLVVEAAGPRLLTDIIDTAVQAGVPTYSAGGDSPDSKRFAFYGIDDQAAGQAAGSLVGQWAADGGILVRRAGVLTGDAGDQRSFDLMRGFVAGLSEIHSGVEWVNGPADVDSFGFEPFAVYDESEAWVLNNIDVDVVFHTDSGLESVARVIADQLLYGDMYAVGFHMNQAVTDYIRERVVVAAMVQGFADQAQQAGLACGDFLLGGVHETGHVVFEPTAVTRDNIDETEWTLPENQ